MNKIMIQCAININKSSIKRKNINGVEHIVVNGKTLPFDIVMNDGLYPEDEIKKSYKTLERTLAPVGHPTDQDGNYISASDPIAIHNFHAGAYCENVRIENDSVAHDFVINVAEAKKTDRGKRLLDRIGELETNEKPRPIHTSVGAFLEVERTDGPKTNSMGLKYNWIARNIVYDHNAILLDSVGAATPAQGVGMAVNADGQKVKVDRVVINEQKQLSDVDQYLQKIRINETGLSYNDIFEQLAQEIKNTVAAEWMMIVDVYPDRVIFETNMGYFQAPYTMSDDTITLAGIPIRVDKTVEYQPKVNQKKGDELMKQLILNALAAAGISTDGLSDEDLLAAYNELQVKGNDGSDGNDSDDSGGETDDASAAIVNAITPIKEQIEALQAMITAKSDKEKDDLVKSVVNSKKYPGITEDAAKLLPLETLKEMFANCTEAHGVPFTTNVDTNNDFAAPAEMPE